MDNSDSGSDNALSDHTYHSYSDDFSSEPHGLLSLVARGSAYIMGESDDDETFEPSEMGWQGDDDTRDFYYRRHRSDSADGTQFEELVSKQKQDSEKIMGNGQFGTPEGLVYIDGSQLSEKRFLCHRLHLAQSRGINFLPPTAVISAFVPNSRGQVSKRYPSRVYSGQFFSRWVIRILSTANCFKDVFLQLYSGFQTTHL
ncbi:hypothetical protein DSO57_1020292 [Entomophthora muscae]|uniref:Uncharacterized protein n=1 Tax=Entomophthora muscae TaxID=34485 RepID=A0ACC2RUX3_9FUNG|nr:hypothetical protein DSO57_1020292 [Entomophthora muscae]